MGYWSCDHFHAEDKNEERLVNIMGGTVIETESERLRKEGKVQMIVEMCLLLLNRWYIVTILGLNKV